MNGIAHSIQFTDKLLNGLQSHFGAAISQIADSISPEDERKSWFTKVQEDPINTYIKNMQFLVTLLQRLEDLYGDEIARITSDLVAKTEHARWCAVQKEAEDHSIESFIDLAWNPLRVVGFEFEVHKKEDGLQIHCTSCPIHQLSKMIGGAKWLAILECNKDLHNMKAFNSRISMTRTKTLMQGDTHCNHHYQLRVLR